jgi:hypothetical protein
MIAYKFLRPGAVGPFSGLAWPVPRASAPGGWVRADTQSPSLCRAAVHACTVEHLPFWMAEELWAIELSQPAAERRSKIVAPAGRLLERVEAWDEQAALDFMAATVERVRALDASSGTSYMTEATIFCEGDTAREDVFGNAALSTMIAVECAERAGGHAAVWRERALQAQWLADRLSLA